jgi:hypothetical protein
MRACLLLYLLDTGLGVRSYLHAIGLGRTDRRRKGFGVWGYGKPAGQYRIPER